MHLLMTVGTIVWFVFVGLLWYMRPGEVAWLAGSMVPRHHLFRRLLLVRDAAEVTG